MIHNTQFRTRPWSNKKGIRYLKFFLENIDLKFTFYALNSSNS